MNYKLIVCDLDETLLDEKRNIPQRNIDILKKAIKEKQIKFVPATGRPFTMIQSFLKDLDLYDKENEYVLSLNGAILSENKNNRILQTNGIETHKVIELIEFGLSHDICVQLYTANNIYIYNLVEEEEKALFTEENISYILKTDRNFDYLKDTAVLKVLFEKRDDDYLHSLEPLMNEINENLNISYSSFRYMEINSSLIDKGKGLINLTNFLNIDSKETIAIGDNFNDISMLEVCGLACAPQNAVEAIKNQCDYVSEYNNCESAVADIIEKFVLK